MNIHILIIKEKKSRGGGREEGIWGLLVNTMGFIYEKINKGERKKGAGKW